MNAALRRLFLENPLIGRQLATQLTGPRLGFIFVLVSGTLLVADVIAFSAALVMDEGALVEGFVGAYLTGINFLVLLVALIVLLPIRVAGAIDGPRMDKVFDQVVVTGVSPLRIQFGNWVLALVFALGVLLASLPFQIYAYMLGGVTLGALWKGYLILAIYANVIIAVALGFSVLEREWLGVPTTIVNFGIATALSFAPLPAVFGWATPARYFASFLVEGSAVQPWWGWEPVLYLYHVPLEYYPFLLWAFIMAPFVTLIVLGPAHRFLPGLNNFGNVVLPGDRRRRFFRKARLTLTRRVELAFFYENRPRWLEGIDYPLRLLVSLGIIFFIWSVVIGLCFNGNPTFSSRAHLARDPPFLLSILFTSLVLFLALITSGDARSKLAWRERVGSLSVPRGILQGAYMLILFAGFMLLHRGVLGRALANDSSIPSAGGAGALQAFENDWSQLIGAIVLFFLNWFLLGRVLARVVETQVALRFLLLVSAGAVLCGPLILAMGLHERWIPREAFPLLFLTPIMVLSVRTEGGMLRDIAPPGFNPDEAFGRYMMWHGALAGVLVLGMAAFLVSGRALRRSRRNASATVGPTAGAAALLFACLACLGPGAIAGEPALPLELELIHSFDGHVFTEPNGESRNFFTLIVRNQGDKEVRGTMWLDLPDNSAGPRRPFAAPPGTATTLRWTEGAHLSQWRGLAGAKLILMASEGKAELSLSQPSYVTRNSRDEMRNYLLVAADAKRPTRGLSERENWVRAPPICLPEDPRSYSQIDVVFVESQDLSRWTRPQRRALLDFVRWGGAVVFFGAIERAGLDPLDGWLTLLSARKSYRTELDGVLLTVEELEESWAVAEVEAPAGPSPVPLLSIRSLGFGRIGHLSLDPRKPPLGRRVWDQVWTVGMPRSDYPSGLSKVSSESVELRDSTSLFAVLGFFCAYSFVVGPLGFFALRRRSRRRWIPIWVLGLPLFFVALLPLLHASLHLRPSYATLTRAAIFGPGARRGVAACRTEIRSSGRQEHAVVCVGLGLSAFTIEHDKELYRRSNYRPRDLVPLPLVPQVDGSSLALIHLQPWGRSEVHWVGQAELKQPIAGSAFYNSRTKRLQLTASGFRSRSEKPTGYALLKLEGEPSVRSASLELARFGDGTLLVELSADPVSDGISKAILRPRMAVTEELGLDLPARQAAYLALDGEDPGIKVRTRDLAFERELADIDARAYKSSGRPAKGVFERDGKVLRSFERSLILVELPLETR